MAAETHAIGAPFIELQSVDSTNNYAMRQVHAGVAQHGVTVFAHEQTAGKGQRSKQWLAQAGANVMMSVVIVPNRLFTLPFFGFSMAMAVAVHGVLKKLTSEAVEIKWPNDLYIRDRKAGGILIENNISGGLWKAAVVGIGLNINQTNFGPLQQTAISLQQVSGKTYDTIDLAKQICQAIEGRLQTLETAPEAIQSAYHEHLYKKEEWVKLKQGPRVFEAQVKGVNSAGQLVTQHAVEEAFNVGDVEWMLP
ncbi:MAG TPA: biotin--[acetyl-CoA-carboxylase] ligase [Chitinophagaceae bacterium]|nr:biotin--[acetyl-CoA-carboxylase] ligase [Chitinophagaceae bacterium]